MPVVPVQAHRGLGIEPLKDGADRRGGTAPGPVPESPFPPAFRDEVDRLGVVPGSRRSRESAREDRWPRYLVERLLLDTGGYIEKRIPPNGDCPVFASELRAAQGAAGPGGMPGSGHRDAGAVRLGRAGWSKGSSSSRPSRIAAGATASTRS